MCLRTPDLTWARCSTRLLHVIATYQLQNISSCATLLLGLVRIVSESA